MKTETAEFLLSNTCKTSAPINDGVINTNNNNQMNNNYDKQNNNSPIIIRKPPLRFNHSSVIINLDKNKINLRRRPRSRLLLPRPLSLPSSFKVLRLFQQHHRDSTTSAKLTTAASATRATFAADTKIDIAFIKALEDDIYQTKDETRLLSKNYLKHQDSCFCCGKREESPATVINETTVQCRIGNDYSTEHGVQLRHPQKSQQIHCDDSNAITDNEKGPSTEIHSTINNKAAAIISERQLNVPYSIRPQSQINSRRTKFKWPFITKANKTVATASVKYRQRSHSWPIFRTNSVLCITPPSKGISKSCDIPLVAHLTNDSKVGYRRWPWLNVIYLWGRRYSFRSKSSTTTTPTTRTTTSVTNNSDRVRNKRNSFINNGTTNGNWHLNNNSSNNQQHQQRSRSSFRVKRHSAGSTTSTTDVVKAWVYRRRFLLHKYLYTLFFCHLTLLL